MILWVEIGFAVLGWLCLSMLIGMVVGRIARAGRSEPLGFDPFVSARAVDAAEVAARAAEGEDSL